MFRHIREGVGKIIYICSRNILTILRDRRDARVVDWGGLENRCPGNWTGGSNPSLSATANAGRSTERCLRLLFLWIARRSLLLRDVSENRKGCAVRIPASAVAGSPARDHERAK